MGVLQVQQIACHYDDQEVIHQVSFGLEQGEICALLGPSGCGKTTILRAIAGFQPLAAGSITLDDTLLSNAQTNLSPDQRNVGMVFQSYALFPHLNVIENIEFGLKARKKSEKRRISEELLALVKLQDRAASYPHELSGGQQQRVALARALAPEPKLLLMDEPFSSLDVELRRSLALEVRDILKQRQITAVVVTHDQEEAFAMADRVGVVNQGKIEQWDTPFTLYHEPATRFVANFVGQGVFLSGQALDGQQVQTEIGIIGGDRCYPWLPKTPVQILLRPDDVVHDETSEFRATVESKVFAGTSTLYNLRLPTGSLIEAAFTSHHDYAIGQDVGICIEADHLIAFAESH